MLRAHDHLLVSHPKVMSSWCSDQASIDQGVSSDAQIRDMKVGAAWAIGEDWQIGRLRDWLAGLLRPAVRPRLLTKPTSRMTQGARVTSDRPRAPQADRQQWPPRFCRKVRKKVDSLSPGSSRYSNESYSSASLSHGACVPAGLPACLLACLPACVIACLCRPERQITPKADLRRRPACPATPAWACPSRSRACAKIMPGLIGYP